MIKRYSSKEMCEIWTSEQKFQIWLELECHACDAMAKLGIIPKKSAENIWKKAKFDVKKIDKIEKITKHDVIAFLTNLSENIGDDGKPKSKLVDTLLSQVQGLADGVHNARKG